MGVFDVESSKYTKLKKAFSVEGGKYVKLKKAFVVEGGKYLKLWSGSVGYFFTKSGNVCTSSNPPTEAFVDNVFASSSPMMPICSYCVDGKFYVFAGAGSGQITHLYYSTNLTTWTCSELTTLSTITESGSGSHKCWVIKYLNGRFVAFSHYTASSKLRLRCYESTDGINWTYKSELGNTSTTNSTGNAIQEKNVHYGIINGSYKYCVHFSLGSTYRYTKYSSDLVTWTDMGYSDKFSAYATCCAEDGTLYALHRNYGGTNYMMVRNLTANTLASDNTINLSSSSSHYFDIVSYDKDYIMCIRTESISSSYGPPTIKNSVLKLRKPESSLSDVTLIASGSSSLEVSSSTTGKHQLTYYDGVYYFMASGNWYYSRDGATWTAVTGGGITPIRKDEKE